MDELDPETDMTDAAPTPAAPDEEAAPVVVAGRRIGGSVLVLVGLAMMLFGGFWYFLVPWFGWGAGDFWAGMAEFADLGGIGTGVLGLVLLVLGGALIQRARPKHFQMLIDASAAAAGQAAAATGDAEKRTGSVPPTIV